MTASNEFYISSAPAWTLVGDGYTETGAHRWEAVQTKGWLILNNGVDLPATRRVGDPTTPPIYELREQGIASVGTIGVHSGMLICADIREIQEEQYDSLFEFAGVILSGTITATQKNNTVTSSADIFTADHVGRVMLYADGTQRNITAYTSATVVTVDGAAVNLVTPQAFKLYAKAAPTAALYSGSINGSILTGYSEVTASANIFTADMVGKVLRFANGYHDVISSYTNGNHVLLTTPMTFDIAGEKFWIVTDPDSYRVSATAPVFTEDMVGLNIVWVGNGATRKITKYISTTEVEVEDFSPVVLAPIGIENPLTYAAFAQTQFTNRTPYKMIWSLVGEPRRFGAMISGAISAGTKILRCEYPFKSWAADQEIVIAGAGIDGGVLTAVITEVRGLGSVLILDRPANTTVTSAAVTRSNTIGSILGSYELQDDASIILRVMDLRGQLVIYRETGIFLGRYTGTVDDPFASDIHV